MRHTTLGPICLAIVLAASGALSLTACGGDSDSSASTEAFCDDLLAINQASEDISDEDALDLIQGAEDSAPSEISEEMSVFVSWLEQGLTFDAATASEEDLAGFDDMATDFEKSLAEIEAFAKENCTNLPDDFFDGGE